MSIRKTKAKAFFKHFLIDTIQVIMALGFVIVYSEAIDLSSIGYAFALWVFMQLLPMAYFIFKTKEL